ncbi:MAG TPA: tetratricopeptide repeat protein, partial [Candidatus Moranbacteria bacterium]|nr:tetratricopeptide repeat protein [Candidatus Moranbacteria bacterium]
NALYNLRFYQGTGIVFEALSTIGALGTFALALIILSFISMSVYLLARDKEKNKIYSLGLLAATFIVLANIIIGRAEGSIMLIGALVGTLTLAVLLKESGSEENYFKFTLKASPKFALTLAFIFMVISAGVVFLFIFVGKAYTADIYAGLAVRESQVTEEGSINKLNRAIGIFNKEGRYYSRLGQEYMVLANNEILKGEEERDLNVIQQYLNNSIASSKRGADLMKNDAQSTEVLAQIYENAGLYVADALKLSEETYRRALELEPNNPNFYVKIGQIKMSQAASVGASSEGGADKENEQKRLVEEAKGLFEESISKKENFAPGHFNLALAQNSLGETDEAIENMSKAFSLDRSSINYAFNLGRLYQARGNDDDNEKAEILFREILKVNDEEINTIFNLGLLLEEIGKRDEAIAEYKKALDLIPDDQEETRERIEKMISNVERGIKNTPENVIESSEEQFPQESLEEEEQVSPTEDELISPTESGSIEDLSQPVE